MKINMRMQQRSTFSGKVVWITGASSGIGRALALAFGASGATVAVSARRQELLDVLVTEIEANGGKARAFGCDVTAEKQLASCVRDIVDAFGRLDVAIANAGFGVTGRVTKMQESDWSRQLAVNVTGLALTAKHAIPLLQQTGGRLVLMGSVGAFLPNPGLSAYGASKAAVHSIGESLQVELMGSGVSCTTIHPGFVESNIARIDNEGRFHPDRSDPRPANLMWPTGKAAAVILRAIARRKKVFVFTGHGKIAVFLGRFFPVLARKLMAKAGNAMPPDTAG